MEDLPDCDQLYKQAIVNAMVMMSRNFSNKQFKGLGFRSSCFFYNVKFLKIKCIETKKGITVYATGAMIKSRGYLTVYTSKLTNI